MMFKARTDRAAVPEPKARGTNPLLIALVIANLVILTLLWLPAIDRLASAGHHLATEIQKQRIAADDTSKPVTRRAVR